MPPKMRPPSPARRPAPPRPAPPRPAPTPPAPQPPAPEPARARNRTVTVNDINAQGSTPFVLSGVIRVWYETDRQGLAKAALILEGYLYGAGDPFDFFVSIGRPDFISAKQQLGDDLGQWVNQSLELVPSQDRRWVNVVQPTPF